MADYLRCELEVNGPFSAVELGMASVFDVIGGGADVRCLNDAYVASIVFLRAMERMAQVCPDGVGDAMARFLAITVDRFLLDSKRVNDTMDAGSVLAGDVPSKIVAQSATGPFYSRSSHG